MLNVSYRHNATWSRVLAKGEMQAYLSHLSEHAVTYAYDLWPVFCTGHLFKLPTSKALQVTN